MSAFPQTPCARSMPAACSTTSTQPCCSTPSLGTGALPRRRCSPGQHAAVPHTQHRQLTTARGLFGLGLPELALVGGAAVLLFGPSKLPSLGKELGKTVKSFQSAAKEFETELKNATEEGKEAVQDAADKEKVQR